MLNNVIQKIGADAIHTVVVKHQSAPTPQPNNVRSMTLWFKFEKAEVVGNALNEPAGCRRTFAATAVILLDDMHHFVNERAKSFAFEFAFEPAGVSSYA